MKSLFKLYLLLFLVLFSGAARADELHGLQIMDSTPVVCNISTAMTWTNTLGVNIRVHQVRSWIGLDYNTKADLAMTVWAPGGNIINQTAFDRYANPAGSVEESRIIEPGVVVPAGQDITAGYFCTKVATTSAHAQFAVTIWYTIEP